MNNIIIKKNFYSDYLGLRKEFESNFSDSKSTHSKRFVWDFWYDQDLYHLVRTPAYHYFDEKKYTNFHSYLVQWGRENLGCHDISPPWLSYYVDGCYQKLHADVPHGPWAFVYSLTPNAKKFKGGETLVLKQKTLDFWKNFSDVSSYEERDFVDIVPSRMNQLIVFDPRFPHGVSEVKGTRNPLEARLVMHGWFVNPRPYVVGGLKTNQVQKKLAEIFKELNLLLSELDLLNGTLSLRLRVQASGEVADFKVLTDTVVSVAGNSADTKILKKELKNKLSSVKFPATGKASLITVPLLFK